jgi:hypothetical protein
MSLLSWGHTRSIFLQLENLDLDSLGLGVTICESAEIRFSKPSSGTVSRPRSLLRRLWWIRGWLCRGGRGKEVVVVDVA